MRDYIYLYIFKKLYRFFSTHNHTHIYIYMKDYIYRYI